MQEFTFDFTEESSGGLRPNPRATRKVAYLVEARNVRRTEFGLEGFRPLVDPFAGDEAVVFPFPQLIRGEGITLLGRQSSLDEVDESDWSVTPVTTYNTTNPAQTLGITPGGQWHMADFGEAFYLFNGNSVVFRSGLDKLHGSPSKVFVQSTVKIRTGCSFNGRAVIGGLDKSNLWNATWQAIFAAWQGQMASESFEVPFLDVDKNWVMWSSIGGGDLPLWLFYPTGYPTDLGPTADRILQKFKSNQLGWMKMPWRGAVLCVKEMDGAVIVYSEDGVAALIPFQGQGDVPPTFGFRKLSSVGVPGRDCVGGNKSQHLFLGTNGELYSVDAKLNVSRLDYSEYVGDMLDSDVRITYDEVESQFFIASAEKGFLLRPEGLFQVYQRPTSLEYVSGATVGLFEEDTEKRVLLVTNQFDMQTEGIKRVSFVTCNVRSLGLVFAALEYKYEHNAEWQRGPWVQLNREGVAYLNLSGIEFRLAFLCYSAEGFELDRVHVKWQKADKRYSRGPNADTSFTGAG